KGDGQGGVPPGRRDEGGRPGGGHGGGAVPQRRAERAAAAGAPEGPQAGDAHRLAPLPDGRLEAGEDGEAAGGRRRRVRGPPVEGRGEGPGRPSRAGRPTPPAPSAPSPGRTPPRPTSAPRTRA